MKIVAVCPSVERQDLVRQLVKSIRASGAPDLPLLVVAMGDDDGTAGWCANQGIGVLRSQEVLPFAKAVNLGVAEALKAMPDAEWILLLNNDLIFPPEDPAFPQPGFWEGLMDMASHDFDIAGAKLLYPDGRIQHCGKWLTLDYFPFHVLRFQPADHADAIEPHAFPCVTFACVAIKRIVWDGLGGLDEAFTNGYEDDDFCLRARLQGAQIGVHPGMLATHLESQTTGKDSANKEAQWMIFKERWIDSGKIQWALGVHQGWRWT